MQPTNHFEAGRKERPENVVATGAPAISGDAVVGMTLTASVSAIDDENGLDRVKFNYQWISNDGTADKEINGATASRFTPVPDQNGHTVKVRVSFTDRGGYEESLTSDYTPQVKTPPSPPLNLQVTVTGGRELTASWDPPASDGDSAVTGYKVQWRPDSQEYDESTTSTRQAETTDLTDPSYRIVGLTDGVTHYVRVMATNQWGYGAASAEAAATLPDITPPELASATVDGAALTLTFNEALDQASTPQTDAFTITVSGSVSEVTGVSVAGSEVSLTLNPPATYNAAVILGYAAPEGSGVSGITDAAGNAAESFHDEPATNLTPMPNVPATGALVIEGVVEIGQTLTASKSAIQDLNGLTGVLFSYQWVFGDGIPETEIAGASQRSYTIVEADEGRTLWARVEFTDNGGYSETLTSTPTTVVPAFDDHGDTPATASFLPSFPIQINEGTIYPFDDIDYFWFEVSSEQAGYIDIHVATQSDNHHIKYYSTALFDENGHCVRRYCDVTGGYPHGTTAYLEPGKYYLRITGPGHNGYPDSVQHNRTYHAYWNDWSVYESRIERCTTIETDFEDPWYGCQEYLKNRTYPGEDINVEPVWGENNLGEGINVVVVVDTGIDYLHEDLLHSVDVDRIVPPGESHLDPGRPHFSHATMVAGMIAAGHNDVGIRGIAPLATLYSYTLPRLLVITKAQTWEVNAMTHHHVDVAVSNNSWSYPSGSVPTRMGENFEQAIIKGITEGFYGKGTSYVFNAGNTLENANFSELKNFYAVINVCGVGLDGDVYRYSGGWSYGDNLWVCAPGGGYTTVALDFYQSASGTSFSTAMVSGVIALVRGANKNLTWRDVKLIMAESARKNDPDHPDWEVGSLHYRSDDQRYSYNHYFGFGVVNAEAAVDLAKEWTNLPAMKTVSADSGQIDLTIPDRKVDEDPTTTEYQLTIEREDDAPTFIEHVEINIEFDHPSFRDLEVELVSPSGTVSTLADPDDDLRGNEFTAEHRFGSAKNIGENPVGTWTLQITDHVSDYQGQLKKWSVIVRGHRSEAVSGPTIVGAPQVGETLTVDTSGIDDADGMSGAVFSYQWLANDAEIADATDPTYTLVDDDAGLTIKVKVSFFDDKNNPETLTSAATTAVLANVPDAPEHLNVSLHDTGALDVSWEAPSTDGGSAIAEYRVQWKETAGNWDAPADVSEETVTGTTHTITGLTDRVEYTVRIIATNDVDDGPPSDEATGTPRETTPPELSTATVDGATLTLTYDEDLDENSEPSPDAFSVTVGGTGRAVDGVSVSGSPVILTLGSAVASGATVTVSYTVPTDAAAPRIQDDAGNPAASFSDQDVENNTPPPANSPATGQPTITGTAQVGDTLTASTSDIDDEDGLANVSFSYQWLANDAEIVGATDPTYTLVDDDAGLTIKVKVSFFDDENNQETLTSEATTTVVTPLTAEFQDAPDKHDGTGVFTFKIAFSEPISIGYVTLRDDSLDVTNGSATKAKRVNGQSDLWVITVEPDSDADVTVVLPITEDCAAQDAVCTRDGTKLSKRSELTVPGPAAANSPATGAPIISGTAQVGETLTVDTSGIDDADGMSGAVFSYQWLADGVDIASATGDTYTLVDADFDKAVKVRVIFNDDDANEETLTSEATAAVAAETAVPDAPQSLNVSPDDTGTLDVSWEAPASDGGSAITGYKVQWKSGSEDYDGSAGSTRQAEITDPASRTHTITGLTDGVEYAVRVIAVNDVSDGPPSDEATGTPRETTPPELATATVDGPTLTLTYDEALDENSEPSSDAFSVAVGGTGRAVDGVSVSGSSVILTLGSAVASGATVTVSYAAPADTAAPRIQDEAGNPAASFSDQDVENNTPPPANSPATGAPTISGTVRAGETLTAETRDIEDDDGLDNAVFTYQWLANGADIAGAASDTYTLVEADAGLTIKVKVSFRDDKNNPETLTSAATAAVEPRPNTPATGAPTISGTVRVGETLTVDTSAIADADGMSGAVFSYQWLADGAGVAGATSDTYTLVADDVGKAIKVRVIFTDNADNEETLTSEATAAVEPRPNTPATGAPTISGTVRVGETLTVDTSDIADADGMSGAVFSY